LRTACLTPTSSALAHDAIAESYDEVFTNSVTGRAQRDLVWRELERCFHPGQRVLELDCGTGVDAAHLAENGVEVWACEESSRMLEVARRRIAASHLDASVHLRLLPTSEISDLQGEAPFDGAFSDFGTLNCLGDMDAVARNLAGLLRPGGKAVLCMAGTCVPWEIIYFAWHGRFRETFRRFGRGPVARLCEAG
jgi:ubiquinone/menaquinone biosynthesis C-methylase UbiE